MDPNEALKQLRAKMKLAQELIDSPSGRETFAFVDAVDEAINLFAGLDQWMSRAGALPDAWAEGR